MTRRILIMAGGTGGHVFPGLAVAEALKAQGWQVDWLGTPLRMEAEIVPKAGFPIHFVNVSGVRGNGAIRLLLAPFQIIRGMWQAHKIIKQLKPDVVLGMGGFASGPGGIAAWLNKIPLVLHEQNAVPGVTNKLLAKIANRVLTGFDHTFAQQANPSKKYHWVGNPVRASFQNIVPRSAKLKPFNVLVVGGSLGAKALNDFVPMCLQHLDNIEVQHQCGKGNKAYVEANYKRYVGTNFSWYVDDFIDDISNAYRWANLVVCRAGALTVAEVAMSGLVAVFIPLPHAVDDHQTKNAQVLVDAKAAYMLSQDELRRGELALLMNAILGEAETLAIMGRHAKSCAKPDATQQVAQHCIDLVEQQA